MEVAFNGGGCALSICLSADALLHFFSAGDNASIFISAMQPASIGPKADSGSAVF